LAMRGTDRDRRVGRAPDAALLFFLPLELAMMVTA